MDNEVKALLEKIEKTLEEEGHSADSNPHCEMCGLVKTIVAKLKEHN
jgi:CRISPR/Cas system-associated exonuclease Cas4 (RecB family)